MPVRKRSVLDNRFALGQFCSLSHRYPGVALAFASLSLRVRLNFFCKQIALLLGFILNSSKVGRNYRVDSFYFKK